MAKPRQSVTDHGKQFRERPTVAPEREVADEQESSQDLSLPVRQQLQAQFGHAEVDMALSGEDISPFGTYILSEWAMGAAGLGSLTESSPGAGAQVHGLLQSEEWGQASAGIISRYATSNQPAHAHLAMELIRRSRGQRLPSDVAARLSAALGVDISDAVIHTDAAAAQAADAVNAHAFATGKDVFFAAGKYQPGTKEGDELLAHELTHVVQDSEGRIPFTSGEGLTVSTPNQTHEREAERAGREAASALHDGGTDIELGLSMGPDAAAEMDAEDAAMGHDVQSAEAGASLHRSADDPIHTYGEGTTPSPEERKALAATMPKWQWKLFRQMERDFHQKVVPATSSIATVVSNAAFDAEYFCEEVFDIVDARLVTLEDKEAAEEMAEERDAEVSEYESEEDVESHESDDSGYSEESDSGSPAAEGAMEEENEDLDWAISDAETSIEIMGEYQKLLGLAIFKQFREFGILYNTLAADGELSSHAHRTQRAAEKTDKAMQLLDSFKQDVLFEMVERELKSKAKDATITALLALVFPPAAAGFAAAKMARWVAGELVGEIVDMVTSDGEPPKYDQNFMNGETKKWSGRAVDIKKLTEDTETLTGPWERIDVLNKTLGRIMKVLEVEEVAKEKLAAIHAALESARLANEALAKQWPEVLMRYNKFQAHAERLSALGPVAAEQAKQIYARIDDLEDYLYSD